MDEREYPARAQTESEALAEQARGTSALERLFPDKAKKEPYRKYISRLRGAEPDGYDILPALVYFERLKNLDAMATAQLTSGHLNGDANFDWSKATHHETVDLLMDFTVSMGGGKGRKEGVELGKSNQPTTQKSRWSLRRRE